MLEDSIAPRMKAERAALGILLYLFSASQD